MSNQLITMSNKLKDNKYCILPFGTINKIRELGLNKCKARKYNSRYLHKPKKVNTKNLIQINTTEKNNSNNIRIATINARSVKNKQLQIDGTAELQNIDFIMLTETWLKNMDEDKAWINTSDLNNNNLRLDTVNRTKRQGGGIALCIKRVQHNETRDKPTVRYIRAQSVVNNNKEQETHPRWYISSTNRIIIG